MNHKRAVNIYTYGDATLGIGTYGKVCSAAYGNRINLPCAAKLLHGSFSQFFEEFVQKCQSLSTIKEPNIVQYLCAFLDNSGKLILLMEKMEMNLTTFLKQSTIPLPYHTELGICHDVAKALAYLHSKNIIHRDLSSNNVLLIIEETCIVAKVTDFMMSELMVMSGKTPLSMYKYRNKLQYMPPEATIASLHNYKETFDCFSFGVLTIQIITRMDPNPDKGSEYVSNSEYSNGRVLVQCPEIERRKKDISIIDHAHPLLPMAKSCIQDLEEERPSSTKLCEQFESLKKEQKYIESVAQDNDHTSSEEKLKQKLNKRQKEINTYRRELQAVLEMKKDIQVLYQTKPQDTCTIKPEKKQESPPDKRQESKSSSSWNSYGAAGLLITALAVILAVFIPSTWPNATQVGPSDIAEPATPLPELCHKIQDSDSKELEKILERIKGPRDKICARLNLTKCNNLEHANKLTPFHLAEAYLREKVDACWEKIVTMLCEDFNERARANEVARKYKIDYKKHCEKKSNL